ncbi:MAG TPA: 4Fe-4S dicluster domain-containing protein [Anaerolineales bacterium]
MLDPDFVNQINDLSGQTIQLCYHCHKCTAGCPVSADMEYGPDRVLHMIQLGQKEQLLSSHDIWLCASCETCGTRCPNEIDIARVMDSLRQVSFKEGSTIGEPDAIKFHRLFLFAVQTLGRSHEASMLIALKLWTLNLMGDMDSGVVMLAKGKVPLIPHPVKARQDVKHIFEETSDQTAR